MESMRATVQRQADTIESLHSAAQKYKTRLNALEQQLTVKQAELDSLKLLSGENANLREENLSMNEKNRELEQAVSRLTESSTLGAESQAQLGVKVQAYQRHNNFLQGEIATIESKLATARERIDVLQNELRHKEQRVTILMDKLRQHNIDPTATSKVHVSEDTFNSMKDQIHSQSTTVELLREKLESMQDEAVRREELLTAQRQENDALKQTVSRLIAQISGVSTAGSSGASVASPAPRRADGATSVPRSPSVNDNKKLDNYRRSRARADEYLNSS